MKQKGLNPKIFIVLTAVAVVGSAGVSYWQHGNASSQEARVRLMKQEIGGSPNLVQQAEISRTNVAQSQLELTHLEMGVATAEYVPTLLQELEATGKQCGLDIIGVRPVAKQQKKKATDSKDDAKEARKPYEELDVEVKCRGEFSTVMTFLQKLADFPKIVGVRHMSLDPKAKSDGLTLESVETTIVLRVYVFSQAGSRGEADGPTQPKPPGGAS